MRLFQVVLNCIVMYSLGACSYSKDLVPGEIVQTVEATSAPTAQSKTSTASLIVITPDVEIDSRNHNQVIILQLGQVFKIKPVSLDVEWQVGFDPDLLESLTQPEMMQAPGPEGWLFRAIAVGEGQITLTSIVSCNEPPCPLMPMSFHLIVLIQ